MNPPPQESEFELSIFGPGYGESILLHVGKGNWIVIDSCIDSYTRLSAPLNYLASLSVNLSDMVKAIIVTHWHDDHIRGISQLFRECKSAKFICSDALNCKEFLELVKAYSKYAQMHCTGVDEFTKIFKLLLENGSDNSLAWAIAERTLYKNHFACDNGEFDCTLIALSPSDQAITNSKLAFNKLLPQPIESKRRIVEPLPNEMSIVLHIQLNDIVILLGSDMENKNGNNSGWSAILNSNTKPDEKADIFKIPHHGSENAFEEKVWKQMLKENPYSLLTPFIRLRNPLPTSETISKFKNLTENLFITHPPRIKRIKDRDRSVQKTINEVVRKIQPTNIRPGQIRIRREIFEPKQDWKVDLFNGAVKIT